VLALRARQQRNFLTTLLLSQGVPMLLGGDELGRTQEGNNNAWCQDNEISWFDWDASDGELLEFARRVIALRREHPVFRRTSFLSGTAGESGLPDAWWFRPDGRRMTQRDWTSSETRTLGVFLNGREIHEQTPRGEPIFDDSFLLVFNAHFEPVVFTLPTRRFGSRWQVELATGEAPEEQLGARALVAVQEHSLVLLRRI
jgi:glycogen operon protein